MKQVDRKAPSQEEIRELVMQMCSREHLAELAQKKGVKDAQRMSKQQLCDVILT